MNKRYITIGLATLAICAMCSELYAAGSSARYDIISSRAPFGKEPPPPPIAPKKVEPAVTKKELNFAKSLRVVYIRRSEDGYRVGIVESRTKPPSTIIMDLGETDGPSGITLLEADYEKQRVKLRKGKVEDWVGTDGPESGASTVMSASGAPTSTRPKPTVPSTRLTYGQRQKIREARNKKVLEQAGKPSRFESPEALEDHLLNYQMDLIRAGGEKGPPLPVPLTPEADAILVDEGHLPPLE